MLPDLITHQVVAALSAAADTSPIRKIIAIPGGAVSACTLITTDHAAYFLKWHRTFPNMAPLVPKHRVCRCWWHVVMATFVGKQI